MQKINRKRLVALLALIGWLVLLLFSGSLRAQGPEQGISAIKIGLLTPSESHREAVYGAQFAVNQVNASGGIGGAQLELLIRHLDGPWGQGTKEVVDLVYKEKVTAILGAHQGRNAHLVEQVIAKTQVPFISAWASDPTLSQAFVPWYFSCVPNSSTQAAALDLEVCQKGGHNKLLLISDGSYDARIDREHFLETLDEKVRRGAELLDVSGNSTSKKDFPFGEFDAIVLFGEPSNLGSLFYDLRGVYAELPVYSTFSMLGEGAFTHLKTADLQGLKVLGSGDWMCLVDHPWYRGFVKEFGRPPGAVAAYAYDATRLLLQSIASSVANKSSLLEQISQTDYRGLTGAISFDERGNRNGMPQLLDFSAGE